MGRARYLAAFVMMVTLAVAPRAAAQADAVAPLLDRLASALTTGDVDAFLADAAPDLEPDARAFLRDVASHPSQTVHLTERARSPGGIAVEVLLAHGDRAVFADWFLTFAVDPTGRLSLTSVSETSRIDDLVRMEPDLARPLTVRDLVIEGPDFRLTLPSGTAVVAYVDGTYAALALQGDATVRFTPNDPVEQGQLRIFGGRPALDESVDEVFVRLNPADADHLVRGVFTPAVAISDRTRDRLEQTFADRASLSHRLELRHLSEATWSLDARPGSLIVEFRTRRGWLTYSRSPNLEQDVSLFDRARRRQISLYASAPDREAIVLVPTAPYDVEHIDLDVVLDPDRRWLRGIAALRLRVNGPTRAIALRLADPLRVVSVTSRLAGPLSSLRSASDDGLVVGWPSALDTADTDEIEIQFQGLLPPQRLDDDAPASRRVAGAEDALGVEPRFLYSSAVPWYPQPPFAEFATATVRVTVPAPFDVVATGTRGVPVASSFAERPGVADRASRTMTFTAEQPIRYLAMLVARLTEVEQAAAHPPEAPTRVLVMEGGSTGAPRRQTAAGVQRILAFYTRLLGLAPFPELTVVTLGDELPSGHSPAYFALINQPVPTTPYVWARDPVAFDDEPDFFLAHEIAHQWWGQTVSGRDYRDQWIVEGFAQYLAWMYVTAEQGTDAGDRLLRRMRETAESFSDEGPIRLGFRVGHLRGDRGAFRAIVYNKAAVVLHQLRRLVGDEAFFAGMRDLVATHRSTTIATDDVERAFQRHAAMPLARFFTRWIRESGIPRLRFTWSATPSMVLVDVAQIGPVFDVPYDLTIELRDGTRRLVPLAVTEARQRFTIAVAGAVRRIDTNDRLTLVDIER